MLSFGNEEGALLHLLYFWISGRWSDPPTDCTKLRDMALLFLSVFCYFL